MSKAYNSLAEACYDSRRTGVSSDDLSRAMVPFVGETKKLSSLPGCESLELAIKLVIDLSSKSSAALGDGDAGEGERPSDELADQLMCRLAQTKRQQTPGGTFVASSRSSRMTATVRQSMV